MPNQVCKKQESLLTCISTLSQIKFLDDPTQLSGIKKLSITFPQFDIFMVISMVDDRIGITVIVWDIFGYFSLFYFEKLLFNFNIVFPVAFGP